MIEKSNFTNDYEKKSKKYSKHKKNEGTLSLAYHLFPEIFSKHLRSGKLAIDIGSGTGRSRKFLEESGFNADGVDIDPNMIKQAKELDIQNKNKYKLIENGIIPHRNSKYDLAFSSLVVLEIPTMENLIAYFKEAARVMKFEGVLIVLTVTDDFYKYDWVSVDTNYPENKTAKSGSRVKIKIKEINLELYDYFWSKNNYIDAAKEAELSLVDVYYPMGSKGDDINWISETIYPPYSIYVFRKTESLKNKKIVAEEQGLNIEIPSGGIFSETERSNNKVQAERNTEIGIQTVIRDEYSKIRLLLAHNEKINFHSIKSEEILTHVTGNDILIHKIDQKGNYTQVFLGTENEHAVKEVTIEPNVIFSEEVAGDYAYSIIDAKNTPAFSNEDLTEYSDNDLIKILNNSSLSLFMNRSKIKNKNNDEDEKFLIENN